jgi:hypothetical protein
VSRLDLHPEPTTATETSPAGYGIARYGWGKEEVRHVSLTKTVELDLPAAGHLGVQEVGCGYAQDGFHGRQFATEFGAVNRCPFCFAQV